MRGVGLLFVLLASPAFASEDRHAAGLARFAYANAPLFQTSFQPAAADLAREAASEVGKQGRSRLRSLTFVAAGQLVSQRSASTRVLSYEARKRQRPPLMQHITASGGIIETVALVGSVEALQATRPAPHRLAALPQPMPLLSKDPAEEIVATEPPTAHKARAVRHARTPSARARMRHMRRARHRHVSSASRKFATRRAKVPRWAKQMFEPVWQDYAFAYQ